MDIFFATIFKRDGISVGNITKALDQLGLDSFEKSYAMPLAASFRELQDLYEDKHNNKGETQDVKDLIIDEIDTIKLGVLDTFRKMGLNPRHKDRKRTKNRNGRRKHKK